MVPSNSKCGRVKTKMVSSTIMFHCDPSAGVGIPEFMMETDECQYLFVWHTDAVCGLTWGNTFTLLALNHLGFSFYFYVKLKYIKFIRVFLLCCFAEPLKHHHMMTAPARAFPGGARRWGWYWPSCWSVWPSVCWDFCCTREREGETMSIQKMQKPENVGVIFIFLTGRNAVNSHACRFVLPLNRELVMQKVAGCCRRGNQVSYKYSKVGRSDERMNPEFI